MRRNIEKYIESGKKRAFASTINFDTRELREIMTLSLGNGEDMFNLMINSMFIGIEAGYRIATKNQKGIKQESN